MRKFDNMSGPEADKVYIQALTRSDNEGCHRFFYQEIGGILHRIRMEVLQGRVKVDEMVNELYIYLSKDGWSKLKGFDGRNGCRLRTWMIPVAWRFFINARRRLLCGESPDEPLCHEAEAAIDDDLRIQIAIDVTSVLKRMSNRRYAEIIRLLLIEGYAPQDVADMLDIRVENVYNLKRRAVCQFIDIYGRY